MSMLDGSMPFTDQVMSEPEDFTAINTNPAGRDDGISTGPAKIIISSNGMTKF